MGNTIYEWSSSARVRNAEGKWTDVPFTFKTSRFTAKSDTPKTYKRVGILEVPSLVSNYNNGLFRIYKTRDGYRVGTYRDGCFWEQFAKAEFSDEVKKMLNI